MKQLLLLLAIASVMLPACSSKSGQRKAVNAVAHVEPVVNKDSAMKAQGFIKARLKRVYSNMLADTIRTYPTVEIHYIDQMYGKGDLLNIDGTSFLVDSVDWGRAQYAFGVYLSEDNGTIELFDAETDQFMASVNVSNTELSAAMRQKYSWIK